MEVFPHPHAFPGPSVNLAAAGGSFIGQARFNGCIVVTTWPRDAVEATLPDELELVPNRSPRPDLHPVAFVLGEQTAGAVLFGGAVVPAGRDYMEFAVAVPFVRGRGGRHLHVWIPRVYSSYYPPVWNGNAFYGFSKGLATMGWQGAMFIVAGEDGGLLAHAAAEPASPWVAEEAALPTFLAVKTIFDLPMVGRKADGTYVCSYFGWDFAGATLRAVDSCVTIDAPLAPGLEPRVCHDAAGGSFEVRGMLWRLSWPLPCRF